MGITAQQKTLRAGYKQTEVGVIPEDWSALPLIALATMKSGESITSANMDQFSRYPCYGGNGLRGFTTRYTHEGSYALIGRQGALCGNVLGVTGRFFASEHAIVVTPLTDTDIIWLTFVLGEMHLNRYSESSAQPGLSVAKIVSLIVAAPPARAEQHAIATTLRDVDRLIGTLDKLLAKKRDVKQAAIQELLTGKRRLPGFSTEWHETTLGNLFTFKNGLNKGKEYFGHGTPIVNYMDVFERSAISPCSLQGRVAVNRTELENFGVKAGDVFFTRTSETVEEVGMAAVILGQPQDTVFSGFILRGRPKDNSLIDGYKAYCFQPIEIRKQITAKASYTTRALTNGRFLSTVRIRIPEKAEQTAIATVLSDMDAGIAALEARRDKTRALKQGMMQQLLTGNIRLI